MIILCVRQAFEYTSGSKQASVLNMSQMYLQGLCKAPNISGYGTIRLNNA